ncbi:MULTISPECIES: bifunctional 2-polyprenyl-6-hydroxyphenol methylase/3-demethylubiquinol 3-O-methyltransferase UbiG [unclassified Streptomyces]|uniref:class I SAM-dependent methyltransferase n=1 Tax=unclassified Streptomyces TaxID=2593676 RepID=UPI00278C5DE2|nr:MULTISPECIES: class I SAM-dependent methyltransferase [unclassified Streptomyces]
MSTSAEQQYDRIGEAFEGFKALPLARYVEVPSFLALVGDVSGRSVLDLACGTGFYSRLFKRRGAVDVFGVDVSGEMVDVARRIESADPLGVRYAVGDVATGGALGEGRYDIATAVNLLNYSETVDAMTAMCRSIHAALAPGGTFYALNQSPDYDCDGPSPRPYGFHCAWEGSRVEVGPRVRVTAFLEPDPVSFVASLPRREVYAEALTRAGFTDVAWSPLAVSEEGRAAFPEGFWDDYAANPPFELLTARRA